MHTVYFVDDEYWLLTELKSIIDWKEYGFEICGFNTDPFQAEREIIQLKPDMVICDIYMDGKNGFELAQAVRTRNSKIAFCFLSAYNKFEYAVTALKLGAVDYLTKPLKKEDLINVITKISNRQIKGNHDKFLEDTLQFLNVDEDFLKRVLKEHFPVERIDKNGNYNFVVICGEEFKEGDEGFFKSEHEKLFKKDDYSIFIIRNYSLEELKAIAENFNCRVSVSPSVTTENYANALQIAVTNASGVLADQKGVVIYKDKGFVKDFLKSLSKCENKYEIKLLVSTFEELINTKMPSAYDVGVCVSEIIMHSMKFGVVFGDEISDKKPITSQFLTVKQLCDALNSVLDKACNKTANSIINSIVKDIQLNFAQVQSLDVYSKKYGYNPSYLSWLFKKETQKSFIEYVIECRMAKAKELLLSTDNSVGETGYLVGYNDYYHFAKAFKQNVGMSPTEYREKYGKTKK